MKQKEAKHKWEEFKLFTNLNNKKSEILKLMARIATIKHDDAMHFLVKLLK